MLKKSRNKIIKETKILSGKSYKECRDFLKSINWNIEDNYMDYYRFTIEENGVFKFLGALKLDPLLDAIDLIKQTVREFADIMVELARSIADGVNEGLFDGLETDREEGKNE